MKLPKPQQLQSHQLTHPKGQRSRFNGDKIRSAEQQGFMARRAAGGLTTVTGSAEPANVKKSSRDVAGFRQPVREIVPPPALTARQENQLHRKSSRRR